jgi:hypothetical protein
VYYVAVCTSSRLYSVRDTSRRQEGSLDVGAFFQWNVAWSITIAYGIIVLKECLYRKERAASRKKK